MWVVDGELDEHGPRCFVNPPVFVQFVDAVVHVSSVCLRWQLAHKTSRSVSRQISAEQPSCLHLALGFRRLVLESVQTIDQRANVNVTLYVCMPVSTNTYRVA